MSVPRSTKLTPADIIARDTKALATSLELAKTLFTTEGYKLHVRHESGPGRFFVERPTPLVDRRTGELTEGYDVDIVAGTCACPLFVRLAERADLAGREHLRPSCKHLAATQLRFAEGYNLIAPFLAVDLTPLIETWKRTSLPAPRRSGRGIPVCKRCMIQMSAAIREGTDQEGHRCPVCEDFLPLGSLRPIPAHPPIITHAPISGGAPSLTTY